ncbi:hypothetical protein BEN48_14540 [Hymenobacter glacialis]|uniref:Protein SirB1 N-terminal domain-containing protein n=1 Tax=Hymenobacter glacialis TaxID=1908236 RepID=A0A1G1T3G1_9BACT|nr:hypothetical protein BEN48_14540 [Hymenobacter glacialis]
MEVLPPARILPSAVEVTHDAYEQAYKELAKMLDGRYPLSFKRAVFISENAYFDSRLDYEEFNSQIVALSQLCRLLKTSNDPYFLYDRADKELVARNAAIFMMMKDSTRLGKGRVVAPFRYDFDDFNGDADWRKMFVSKLLISHKGNCHSLPFLYKMIADETGAPTWLSLAPNHIYLKQHNQKDGWYNTELTSRTFPNDAWLTASGYISKETIVSGIYMDTLSAKQNVVLCLVDLAKGYERRVGPAAAEPFILKCTELALLHFPHYINAQLLRAEALRHQFERQQSTATSQQAFAAMEAAYTRIFETGYREMPAQMYTDWLQAVVKEKAKYQTQH